MKNQYKTFEDAEADGWVRCSRYGTIKRIGTWFLKSMDVSGINSWGYDFAVRLAYREFPHDGPDIPEYLWKYPDSDPFGHCRDLARSQTIYLTEVKNAIGRMGAFVQMYRGEDVQAAIQKAEQAWKEAQGRL